MKRLIAATIALTLLGSTAALADGYYDHGYDRHEDGDGAGAALAVGAGIAALAIIASQHHDHDGYYGRAYYRGPDGYYYNRDRAYYGNGYYYDHPTYGDRHEEEDDDD